MAGVMRCPIVVGRDAELAHVDALLDAVLAGSGGAVAFVGEPGIGKTRIVGEFVRRADARGLRAFSGRTSGATGTAALRPVVELAIGASRVWPVLPEGLQEYKAILARLYPAWGAPAPDDVPPIVIADAILRLVSLAKEGVVITIEDLHWADPDSLQVVEFLAENARQAGIGIVVTTRPESGEALDLILTLGARNAVAEHRLARLTSPEVAAFARACLQTTSLDAGVESLLTAASGVPLLLEDLLADAGSNGLLHRVDDNWTYDIADNDPPPGFVTSVRGRVESLAGIGPDAIRAAAVLGLPFEAAWIAQACGAQESDTTAALRSAVQSLLIETDSSSGRYAFRHALTREVVLHSLTPEARRVFAGRLAELGRHWGIASDVVAELLATAGRRDDAARMLMQASDDERLTGTRESGIRMLGRAHCLAVQPEVSQAAAIAYVTALAEVGRAADARRIAATVLPFLPGADAAALRLTLAAAALAAEDVDGARREVDLAVATANLDDAQWAQVWALRAGIALGSVESGRVVEAEHLAHRAVASARATQRPEALCQALLVLGRCSRLRDLSAAEEAFVLARDAAAGSALPLLQMHALGELGTVQMMRDVRVDTLMAAHDAAVALGDLVTATMITVNLAGARIMRGELLEAEQLAHRGQESARRYGLAGALPTLIVFEGIARGLQGHRTKMEVALAQAEALAPGNPDVLAASWAIGRATLAQLDDDRERALRCLARADEILRSRPALMVDPAVGPLLLTESLGRALTDHEIDAAEVRSGVGSAWTAMWIEATRAVHAGSQGLDPSPHLTRGRAAAHRYPVFGLVAQRLTAEAAVRGGWGGDVVPWLVDLELAAIDRGYLRTASACRALARRAGATVPRRRAVDAELPDTLRRIGVTAREAEVLALMPLRLTNVQIADRLYLSPRTVEKHVASLLTKTGARSRTALAELAQHPAPAQYDENVAHGPELG